MRSYLVGQGWSVVEQTRVSLFKRYGLPAPTNDAPMRDVVAVSAPLSRAAEAAKGKVKLVKVNVDNSPRLSQRFSAQSIPTLLIMREGKVLARQTGAAPLATLRSWADTALAKLPQ